jgi:hypothetical protein
MNKEIPICYGCRAKGEYCVNQVVADNRIKFHPKEMRIETIEQAVEDCPLLLEGETNVRGGENT